ncbi:MAG TPA: biotin/lipoyl-binding carrier protein [Dehalococcoidia bacterium]|nr:biotin/lipoyl-binding carrier protein [Dehalococcoidia bacterium]
MDVKAPMVGKIIEVVVESGSRVAAEDDLVIIESMKMEIPVGAPRAGTVKEIRVAAGDAVQEGDLLLVLE